MSDPRDSKIDAPTIDNLVIALEGLTSLLKMDPTVSNAGKILAQLKQLQTAYQTLDPKAKKIVDDHLKGNNPGLYDALQKKSGSNKQAAAAKIFEDGTIINDSLKSELDKITKEHSFLITMKTTAIPSHEEPEAEFFMPDTFRVTEAKTNDNPLKEALDSAARHQDHTSYIAGAFFGTPDDEPADPLTAVVEAFEVLLRTQIHKDKILSGEQKPKGYDNAYRDTLLKQINIINIHKDALNDITLDVKNHENLTAIKHKLNEFKIDTVPARLKLAGAISALIDISLIKSLREFQGKPQLDTPRY